MPANLENSAVATGLEKVSFHSNSKERQSKECSNYHTIALISNASEVMLKILQARLQWYVNQELPDVPAGFRTRDQTANICRIIKKAREFQKNISVQFSSSLSGVLLFTNPWTTARQASMSITNSRSLLQLMSIRSVMPFNHLILFHLLLLPPSIFPSIRVFSNESVLLIRCPKYWSFSFSISPSNEYSGLISFRMDWLALLAVQGTVKSLLQHGEDSSSSSSPYKGTNLSIEHTM